MTHRIQVRSTQEGVGPDIFKLFLKHARDTFLTFCTYLVRLFFNALPHWTYYNYVLFSHLHLIIIIVIIVIVIVIIIIIIIVIIEINIIKSLQLFGLPPIPSSEMYQQQRRWQASTETSKRAKCRSVRKIVDAILNNFNTVIVLLFNPRNLLLLIIY